MIDSELATILVRKFRVKCKKLEFEVILGKEERFALLGRLGVPESNRQEN